MLAGSTLRPARIAVVGGSFAALTAIVAWLVRPFDGGPAATDAAASVLYWDRIVAHRQLEAFVDSTPKPLLTVVLGGLHALTGDWVAGSFVTVLALAAGIVMAAELARRVEGPEAAAFAAVALIGSAALLAETSWGYGLPWAFAFWMAAGVALMRPVPRYGWAGGFLLLAALARPETLLFTAAATAYLAWRVVRGPRPARSGGLILIGWLAVVVMAVHDLLLTGDPLWWTKVASISVAGRPVASVGGVARLNATHLLALRGLVVVGAVGAVVLIRKRAWLAFWGLAVMGPGVALFTMLLALRGLKVLGHYLHPIDIAVILGAAIGAGAILAEVRRRAATRVPRTRRPALTATLVASAAVAAVLLSSPFAPTSATARRTIGAEATAAVRVDAMVPVLEPAVVTLPPREAPDPGPYATPAPADIVVFAPRYQVNRLAVILGVPVSRIRWLDPALVDLAGGYPSSGSLLYFDGLLSPTTVTEATAVLRPSAPTVVGNVRVVPVFVDTGRRIWVERIEAAP